MTRTAPKAKVRKINWDVIRVLAVFAVVLQHATHAGRINHPELGPSPLSFPLQIGASALVVISAFFVCASLNGGRPGAVLRSRLARLVPAYLVAVVLTYAVLTTLAPDGWSSLRPRDLAFNLLMMQNWVPDVRFVDYSYWTLPVQVTGFVVACALFAGRFGGGRPLRVLLFTLPVAPLVARMFVEDWAWLRTLYIGLAMHRAHLFAIGAALWLWSKGRLAGHWTAVLAGLALWAQYVHSADLPSTLGVGVLLAAMAAAAVGPDWNGALLRPFAPLVRWLAGISYGVYLLNQEIGYLLMREVQRLGGGALPQVATAVGAAVLFGWLLTRWVERPAHAFLTRPRRSALPGGMPVVRPRAAEPFVAAPHLAPSPVR
ncbi:MAG TPA: acyltransferase [Pseudonocardiaceae bacterium]